MRREDLQRSDRLVSDALNLISPKRMAAMNNMVVLIAARRTLFCSDCTKGWR